MPRQKQRRQDLWKTWMDSDPEFYNDLRVVENDLFCDFCGRIIYVTTPSKAKRHITSHASSQREKSMFAYELTKAFLAADIPLEKLNHPKLRSFFERYVGPHVPHPNTLRLRYVDQVYASVMQNMRKDIADNFVYFIVDEGTDVRGHSVANFIIGTLQKDRSGDSHLVASKMLEKTNHETIVTFVNDCFNYVWPGQTNYSNKILVMLSDATAYMLKAGKILSQKYKYMVHFTCAAYTLNRIAETIRYKFPLVDELISNVNKIFLKAPTRKEMFETTLPHVPLPPEPIASQSGTWLQIIAYYDEHFEGLKAVIDCFDARENKAIHICQEVMNNENIRENIRYINTTYGMLVSAITQLETRGLALREQFAILNNVKHKVNNSTGPFSSEIKAEMVNMFQKNPGYYILECICKFANGSYQKLPPSILKYRTCIHNFLYCPLSSVDMERSFLLHKNILQAQRQNLSPGNLEKLVVTKFAHRNSCTQ